MNSEMATMTVKQRRWSPYNLTGFKRTSNLAYYSFLSTISIAFILYMYKSMWIKSIYCNPNSSELPAPAGDCYWYLQPGSRYYWGIQLHLSTCFPALGLAILQFTPKIRQTFPRFHRWAGRLSMILSLIATISICFVADVAMGGTKATFFSTIGLGILSLISHYKAYTYIRAGEIHLHRRWMLRTWGWLGSVITMRPVIIAMIIMGSRYQTHLQDYAWLEVSCAKLINMVILGRSKRGVPGTYNVFEKYPQCVKPEFLPANLTSLMQTVMDNKTTIIPDVILQAIQPDASVIVSANVKGRQIDEMVTAAAVVFGPAFWVAITIHLILVEVYLAKTKDEDDRLKKMSDFRKRRGVIMGAGDGVKTVSIEDKKSL